MGWRMANGQPYKMKAKRMLDRMQQIGIVEKGTTTILTLTREGEKRLSERRKSTRKNDQKRPLQK
jgi:hypothetical protein